MKILARNDGLTNDFNGMGGVGDGFANLKYEFLQSVNSFNAGKLYKHNGLLKKIIDLPASDATRNWITIENDSSGKVATYLKKINAKLHLTNALKITRLHGSALVVLNVSDGEDDVLASVNISKISDISISYVFTPAQFQPIFDTANVLNYNALWQESDRSISTDSLSRHKLTKYTWMQATFPLHHPSCKAVLVARVTALKPR